LVADDNGTQARIVDRSLIKAGGDIGRDAKLACLENDDADSPSVCLLSFNHFMQLALCRIEDKWLQWARFWAQLQAVVSKIFEVIAQSCRVLALSQDVF